MSLPAEVRRHAAEVTGRARHVTIDRDALEAFDVEDAMEPIEPDPVRHYLDGDPADVADYVLTLNALNFGSGWFPTLRKRPGSSGYWTVAWGLADRFRADGPWTAEQLRRISTAELAATLDQSPGNELVALYGEALRALGRWLGDRRAIEVFDAAGGSAARLAAAVVAGMPFYRDRGLYKRAQILGADVETFGVGELHDLDDLTMFADNLVPHVLRCAGVLRYDEPLAAQIDEQRVLPLHQAEHEIRCAALHAVELLSARTSIPPRRIDAWLWHRGQDPEIKARPRHRCRCVYY
jgi:hypothetical protein